MFSLFRGWLLERRNAKYFGFPVDLRENVYHRYSVYMDATLHKFVLSLHSCNSFDEPFKDESIDAIDI